MDSETHDQTAMYDRREKILNYNHLRIMDTVVFYEDFLLNYIIRKYYFKPTYDNPTWQSLRKFMNERMNLMDRYKVVIDIARSVGINKQERFKGFDSLIKMRNDIAHNPTYLGTYKPDSNTLTIYLGGRDLTWNEYLQKLSNWATLTQQMAEFLYKLLDKEEINPDRRPTRICYCETIGDSLLVQKALIYPQPEGDYVAFWRNGTNLEMGSLLNEERLFNERLSAE